MAHIVDAALADRAKKGDPVRVCLVGAGFQAKGIALQIETFTQGMVVCAIANRTVETAFACFEGAGIPRNQITEVTTAEHLAKVYQAGGRAVCRSYLPLMEWQGTEVIFEATGHVEFSAGVALEAFKHKKHVVAMNAELDGTLGPILKHKADAAGVIWSNSDGDQPGVIMNLVRWVKSIGARPLLCGNIKGFHDTHRNPETQKEFAEATMQNPYMVTSFCDGTKVSFEMAVVANATGMVCDTRAMHGYALDDHIDSAYHLFEERLLGIAEDPKAPGIVDYVIMKKAPQNKPPGGVFVVAHMSHQAQQHYLRYYKMGDGPLYTFYSPYHLCHLEAGLSCARVALFQDPVCTPIGGPVVDVVTVAKIKLLKGDVIDSIGGFKCYGITENSTIVRKERLLPMGLAEGCIIKRDIGMDQLLMFDDVEVPARRTIDSLWVEQDAIFFP